MHSLEEQYGLREACDDALQRKANLPFVDLVALVERAGFEKAGGKGSHDVWHHPTHRTDSPLSDIVTLQSHKGKAKPYQIRQVVRFIRIARPKNEV